MKLKLSPLLLAAALFAGLPLTSSHAEIGISVGIAPPPIPVYEQPYCPTDGYIWTPGYWEYADFGYYWVPGEWVAPPRIGVLWTPGYWGYDGSQYAFNEGYWAPTVGFYGGIDYGYGYGGQGYYGGEWSGDRFRYNTAFSRVNRSVIQNTYVNQQVPKNVGSRIGFNGPGGATAKATVQEQAVAKAERIQATSAQQARIAAAKANPALHAANNGGKPKADAINALKRASGKGTQGTTAGATQPLGKGQSAAKGNSGFGQKQGDAATRTKGSQNNAYGKAQSSSVRSSGAGSRAARTQKSASPKMRNSSPATHNVRSTAPRASRPAQGRAPRMQQAAPSRRMGPPAGGRAAGAAAQGGGKGKKKPAEKGAH